MPSQKKPSPTQKVLSLRDSVKGAVVELLESEGMGCLYTQDGLVSLISALAHYREEGRELFPHIFVFDSLHMILSLMPGSEHVSIGKGEKSAETMARALKKCAPLARTGWGVYIERQPDCFAYGLLRSGATVLSVSPADILVKKGDPSVPVLILQQVGPSVIEVRGVAHSSLRVHFGAAREQDASPAPALYGLIRSIVSDVPSVLQEQAATLYQGILTEVLHAGHGTLAVVIPRKKKVLPRQFSDSIVLNPATAVCDKIKNLLLTSESQLNMQLQACASLITGMLLSDGITVFGTDASVRAYNAFVKHPRTKSAEASAGGARHRTFQVLCKMVGKELQSAYMQSQDGRAEFFGGDQDEH